MHASKVLPNVLPPPPLLLTQRAFGAKDVTCDSSVPLEVEKLLMTSPLNVRGFAALPQARMAGTCQELGNCRFHARSRSYVSLQCGCLQFVKLLMLLCLQACGSSEQLRTRKWSFYCPAFCRISSQSLLEFLMRGSLNFVTNRHTSCAFRFPACHYVVGSRSYKGHPCGIEDCGCQKMSSRQIFVAGFGGRDRAHSAELPMQDDSTEESGDEILSDSPDDEPVRPGL